MRTLGLCLMAMALGCGSSSAPPAGHDAAADHGPPIDGAADAPADAAAVDGAPADASLDGSGAPDHGADLAASDAVAPDASRAEVAADASAIDLGGSDGADGGPSAFLAIDPCVDPQSYGAVMAAPTITFVADQLAGYTPRCVKVLRHSTVTWVASGTTFGDHPLSPGTTGTAGNPIPPTASGTSRAITFDDAGFFPFHCQQHPVPMRGVIWVIEQ
jgi:plastocyanin